jgi:type IV secretion system protein VirB10
MKALVLSVAIVGFQAALQAQTAAPPVVGAPAPSSAPASATPQASTPPAQPAPDPAVPSNGAVEIPAGTKILCALKAAVDTSVAKPGDQVFLTSTFPVIAHDRVVIPSGMDVMGVIDSVVRPGRVKGRAAVTMHFTTLILPNGSVVGIPSSVNAVPGAGGPAVKGSESTIKQASSAGQDGRNIQGSAAMGASVGGVAALGSGNIGAGVGYGAAAGGGAGVIYTLLTRGKDVVLGVGQPLEISLQRPLILDRKDVYTPPPGSGTQFVPSPNQPKPLPKPKPQP